MQKSAAAAAEVEAKCPPLLSHLELFFLVDRRRAYKGEQWRRDSGPKVKKKALDGGGAIFVLPPNPVVGGMVVPAGSVSLMCANAGAHYLLVPASVTVSRKSKMQDFQFLFLSFQRTIECIL